MRNKMEELIIAGIVACSVVVAISVLKIYRTLFGK